MDLSFLLFLSFYLISCTNSVSIDNDELSEDEYVSDVQTRVARSPSRWNYGEEKRSFQRKKDLSEEQPDELRHDNVIYISFAGNPERSMESPDEKHESSNLWSLLGKTTDFFVPPFMKALLPRTLIDSPRPKYDPPPYYDTGIHP